MALLGIDMGTTWCKAAAVSEEGHELAAHRSAVPWEPVATGAEIDAERLVELALASARAVLERMPGEPVTGIGLTGMAEAGVLLDARDRPTAPVIAWYDSRGTEEAELLERELGAERFSAATGLPPGPQWTLAKYRWMRTHLPSTAAGVRWLNVPEWIVRRLGGEHASELSLASRTGLLELDRREPWPAALDWAGAPRDLLPAGAPAGTALGRAGDALREARGAVLCVAGHDHLCAAVGAGATGGDDLFNSCGSAEVLVRPVDAPLPAASRLRATSVGVTNGWHTLPGRQYLLGSLEGGLALQRAGRALGAGDEHARSALDEAALDVAPAPGGAALLEGRAEPAPAGAGAAERWRGVLEAQAERGAAVLASLEALAGPCARIAAGGGGVRSAAARATKRDAFGPFERALVDEPGARGAALLAGIAAGVFGAVDELPAPATSPTEALT